MDKINASYKCFEMNKKKGIAIYSPYYIGESIKHVFGVEAGWYIVNKETRKISTGEDLK